MSLQQARDFMNSFVVANIILHSFILVCCQENARPIVNITLGSIVGSILKSDNGRDFYAYRGIPYAKPPTKNLRFRVSITNIWSRFCFSRLINDALLFVIEEIRNLFLLR